jgi:hypothetical protein
MDTSTAESTQAGQAPQRPRRHSRQVTLRHTVDGVELGLHDAVEVVSNISIEYGARHCCGLPVTTIDFHPSTRSPTSTRRESA